MNKLPKSIQDKLVFLTSNGFILDENVKNIHIYDSNLSLPKYNDIEKLQNNLSKYIINYNHSIICNFMEYWNDHHFFIQTFPNEKNFYELYGFDSWINHFINARLVDDLALAMETKLANELETSLVLLME